VRLRLCLSRSSLGLGWLVAYGAIWALTVGCAVIVAIAGAWLSVPVHHLLALRLTPASNPPPDPGRVLALAVHNLPIASWPLLLGAVGAHQSRAGRRAADCLVLACVAVNVAPVGAALGAYGAALLPYVPQLPLEWGALAAGGAAWLKQRRDTVSITEGVALFALLAVLLLCAAVTETIAVPHR
jgi:hypothetical protein